MITAKRANYIKLGEKGSYEEFCFGQGVLALGFHEVPHPLPADRKGIYEIYKALGSKPSTCTSYMNQVVEFYQTEEEVLWFTFAHGKLYWCFAAPEIILITNDPTATGPSRYRATRDGWHDTDIAGNPLHMHALNGNLTKIMGYQSTLCALGEDRLDYLLRRINGQELPQIARAVESKVAILASITEMMRLLNPKDFELLVELVFAQSGWKRLSPSGGTQKTIDIEMYLPTTHEYAFAQVKSETNQRQLAEYEAAASERHDNYMLYVYHSAKGALTATQHKTRLIDAQKLSDMVLSAGLFDWLLKKSR